MSHLSQLPRYTPECQQIAHYRPGGADLDPDTRQTEQSCPWGDDDWDQDSVRSLSLLLLLTSREYFSPCSEPLL